MELPPGELARRLVAGAVDPAMAQHGCQNGPHQLRHTAPQRCPEHDIVMQDVAKSVLASFGLRPFHVFDGEKYHVGFAVADALRHELKYEPRVLDEFFSNCDRFPLTSNNHRDVPRVLDETFSNSDRFPLASNNHKDAPQVPEVPACENAEMPVPSPKDTDKQSSPVSPKEVHYIMEEFYPSEIENDDLLENCVQDESEKVPVPAACGRKDIVFIMEDNDRSPEEMRLSTCFPSVLHPSSPKPTANDNNGAIQGQTTPLDVEASAAAELVEPSSRTSAGKVKDDKSLKPKKKVRKMEDCNPSESVRLHKVYATTATPKKRKKSAKRGTHEPPEGEPSWNGRDVGDLEEQIGDSWMQEEEPGISPEGKLGNGIIVGQGKRSFWPTPLYCSPGARVKPPAVQEHKRIASPVRSFFDEENSDGDELQESHEQSRKREEVALTKYALLFKDDRSWRKKFLDGFKLTCDICFSKRKVERFTSVMALLAHANSVKKVKLPEHRGYARAIMSLLHLDEPGSTPACDSCAGSASYDSDTVWPPVVVLENTAIAIGLNGCFVGLTTKDIDQMLRALGDRGKRKVHQVLGENGLTGQALVEFPSTHRGWIDANRLHRHFELQARSYEDWSRLKPKYRDLLVDTIETQENHGLLTILKDNKSLKRFLYGYLVTPQLIEDIDPDKQYVKWAACTLKDVLDTSDSRNG